MVDFLSIEEVDDKGVVEILGTSSILTKPPSPWIAITYWY